MFRKIKDKIQEIRFNRKLKKLFPKLSVIAKLNKLDTSKYNIRYCMNQKTLDKLKSVLQEKIVAYNVTVVPDDLLKDGEVMQIQSPKNPEPVEIVYGAPIMPYPVYGGK